MLLHYLTKINYVATFLKLALIVILRYMKNSILLLTESVHIVFIELEEK